MKKLFIGVILLLSLSPVHALTFMFNGIWYGTVCRNGIYYTSYPRSMAQPVGSICPVRDIYGNIIMRGVVTDE